MADSVRELIMKWMQATLQTITVSNGYSVTLNAVERVLQGGQSHRPPMAILVEGDDQVVDRSQQDSGGVATLREWEIGVIVEMMQDETRDARSASEMLNDAVADVQRALASDWTCGGHAILMKEMSVDPILLVDAKRKVMTVINYMVRYRHAWANPRVAV